MNDERPPLRCRTVILVRSYELDSFGHVNNAVYLNYLEAARCDLMRQLGLRFDAFFETGQFPVLVRAELDYRAPATCDDELVIITEVVEQRSRSFVLGYTITKGNEGPLILTARTIHVFVDSNNKLIGIPDWFRSAVEAARS